MKLNEKIIYCRKKAGLSQLDLADLLGVSRQSVSKWETGESNPEITKIPPLAKAFGVTADWLLSEEEPEEAPCAGNPEPPAGKAYPDWVDNLPRHIGSMIKRFGWLCGVRLAVGGALFTAIGCIARAMFKRMIFGSMPTDYATSWGGPVPSDMEIVMEGFGTSYYSGFNSQAWHTASVFTGFVICLGIALTIGGILLAVVLKKWGSNSAK